MSAAKLSLTHLNALRTHGAHLLSALALASLVACGGGGGGDAAATGVLLSGYAATGLALANATVDIKCAKGADTTSTDASGFYKANLANAVLPCVLKVTNNAAGSNNVTLFSVATGSGSGAVVANITPLTQLVVANATGNDPAAFFASFNGEQLDTISSSSLSSAITKVADELKPIVDISTTNPLTGSLTPATSNSTPNSDPYDLLLEQLKAAITNAGTTLDAVTTSMLPPSGNTPQPKASAVLQSQEAKDFAEGLYDIFAEEANGTYGIEKHASIGSPTNGVYNISHTEWTTANSGAAWSEGINLSADWYLNAAGNWEREPATGTLKQTEPGKFLYTTSLFAVNMAITAAPATTLDLADLGGGINARGVIDLPAGSKIFTFGRSVRTADEYRMNGGTGYSNLTTLQAFIDAKSNANNTVCKNSVCWWFGAGNVLNTNTTATGSWIKQTVSGKELLMVTLPAELQSTARLSTGQKYFYALNPAGNVQEGKFSPAGSFDIEDQGSNISLNKVALDAVMQHLTLGNFEGNAPVGSGETPTPPAPTPTTPSAALLSTNRTLLTSNTSPPSGVTPAAVDASLASYYQQHCTNSGLQGIYFPAGSTVTSVNASALVGKSFRIATCNLGNPAEDSLTFNANGTVTDLGDHGAGTVNTIIRSSSDIAAVFSSNGSTEPGSSDTTYLQAYKVTVGGVDKYFIADYETFNGTASYFGWLQEYVAP